MFQIIKQSLISDSDNLRKYKMQFLMMISFIKGRKLSKPIIAPIIAFWT